MCCSPYGLEAATITADLTSERPTWTLSAYGPGRNAPVQLFGGLPREQSFEEMRLQHYNLAFQGLQQQAVLEAQTLTSSAEEQNRQAVRTPDKAVKYIIDGQNQHPNRLDVCKNAIANQNAWEAIQRQAPPLNPFARQGAPFDPPSTFGQTSTTGNASGKPSAAAPPFSQTRPAAQVSSFPESAAPASQQNPFATAEINPFAKSATHVSTHPPNSPVAAPAAHSNPFSKSVAANPCTASQQLNNLGNPQARRHDNSGRLVSWNGRSVKEIEGDLCFQRDDGDWERISFPDPPQWRKQEDLPPDMHDTTPEKAYEYMKIHGIFENGIVPEMAPMRAWLNWDF